MVPCVSLFVETMAKRIVSYGVPFLLAGLVLVQSVSLSLIQLDFMWNRETITALFCVNLDRPEMNCAGSCELGRRLEKAADTEQPHDLRLVESISAVFVLATAYVFPARFGFKMPDQRLAVYTVYGSGQVFPAGIFHPPRL